MRSPHSGAWAPSWLALSALVLSAMGCQGLLGIEDIEFRDVASGGSDAGVGAGGSSSASGGAGGLGGSPGPSAEDCTNALDDNDDGLVDCDDPLCACVELPAAGNWNGPAVLYRGPAGSVPACPADWPNLVLVGFAGSLDAPPATCTPCSCGSATGISCPPAPVTFYTDAACTAGALTQTGSSNSCTAVTDAADLFDSVIAQPTTPSGGSCPASGGDVDTLPVASFSEAAVLCEGAAAGSSCSAGGCLPRATAPYLASVCIYKNGGGNCPAPFTDEHTIFAGIDDGRGCTACTCSAPSGASCSGTTRLYGSYLNTNCQSTFATIPHDGNCQPAPTPGSMMYVPGNPSGGTCTASGGEPTGSAVGSDAMMVCCLP